MSSNSETPLMINGIKATEVAGLYAQTAAIYILVGLVIVHLGVLDCNTYKGMTVTMAVSVAVAILAAVYGAEDKVIYMVQK